MDIRAVFTCDTNRMCVQPIFRVGNMNYFTRFRQRFIAKKTTDI